MRRGVRAHVSAELLVLWYACAFAAALLMLVHAPQRAHYVPVLVICALLPLASLAHHLDPHTFAARLLFAVAWPALPLASLLARRRALVVGLASLTLYGLSVARWGGPWWPWPLRVPRLVVGILASAIALRREGRWSLRERVGLYFAAGQCACILAGTWPSWENVRAVSAIVVTIAVADLACQSRGG